MSQVRNFPDKRSSLLTEALDIPSLDHHRCSGKTDRYLDDHGDSDATEHSRSNCTPQMSPPPLTESNSTPRHHQRTMSSFDTPVIRNHAMKTLIGSEFPPNSLNQPVLMKNSAVYEGYGTHSFQSANSSSGVNSSANSLGQGENMFPRHSDVSDYTIPTSNLLVANGDSETYANRIEPPLVIQSSKVEPTDSFGRRSILGSNVGKKYHCSETDRSRSLERTPVEKEYGSIPPPIDVVDAETDPILQGKHHNQMGDLTPSPAILLNPHHNRSSSRMTPKILPSKEFPDYHFHDEGTLKGQNDQYAKYRKIVTAGERQSLLPRPVPNRTSDEDSPCRNQKHYHHIHHRHSALHKSIHAQSLLVGLAFMVVWLPNNAMAPNLTQMADYFGMSDAERDLYLGSYCALALGVFSLPLSGSIGFMADFYSRKHLFLACCGLGALSAAWSAWSPNYWNLFASRLCSGGCMSGSVPVAFSLLGDLFSKEERNAASSGLTSMMGLGIILGQVYAGEVGPSKSWQYPFYVSAVVQVIMTVMIALWVEEPVRGGKEKALQGMLKSGNKYERRLTLNGFIDTMRKNASNWILLWQGFLTSLPWGIVFVFLNDYLSQEKGFSVQEATFLVMLFGVGCAMGGITGGYLGQIFMRGDRSFLPLYMAAATFLGIFPFLLLLNSEFPNHNGFRSKLYSVLGGCIASLPSVNIRPCIINVNPPESRGAALTAANLFVTLGRGIGPCCITLLGSVFAFSRQTSFNFTLSFFWTISAIQLLFLANTLPKDQDAMEEGLARYAAAAAAAEDDDTSSTVEKGSLGDDHSLAMSPIKVYSSEILAPKTPDRRSLTGEVDDDDDLYNTIMSSPPPQYMTIDGKSARQSFEFIKIGIQELGDEITHINAYCRGCDTLSPCESNDDIKDSPNSEGASPNGTDIDETLKMDTSILEEDEWISQEEMERRREVWIRQQLKQQPE